jgi:predicted phage baseplate assembly protein
VPFADPPSAAAALAQDPRQALPRVTIADTPSDPADQPLEWLPVLDLLSSDPGDLVFVVDVEDDGSARLRFGDGELGRSPGPGDRFVVSYRTGNGTRGNVGAESIARVVFSADVAEGATIAARNPLPATGGTDPEPAADAKLIGPGAFRTTIERAITADDYATLAELDPRLQRAAATLDWNGSWYEARVAVDPLGSEDPAEALLAGIDAELQAFRRIGQDLAVVAADYVPLDVGLTVCVLPDYLRGDVQAAVLDALSALRLPDGCLGLFHPDNESFGTTVAGSVIVAAVQGVVGVQSAIVTKLQRLDDPPQGEIEQGFLPLGPTEIARLDSDADFPENGRLTLDLRGGR